MLLAFEVEHGVDDVLERLRPGEVAVLRDVADEKRRDVLPLAANISRVADSRTWPMLPGRRLDLQREHGLDRIDDHETPASPRDLLEDPLERGFARMRAARASMPSRSPRDLIWCSDSSPEL